jgi:hypothetical protein
LQHLERHTALAIEGFVLRRQNGIQPIHLRPGGREAVTQVGQAADVGVDALQGDHERHQTGQYATHPVAK